MVTAACATTFAIAWAMAAAAQDAASPTPDAPVASETTPTADPAALDRADPPAPGPTTSTTLTGAPAGAARILVVPPRGASPARVVELYAGLRAAGLLVVESDERVGVDLPIEAPPAPGARETVRAHLQDARTRYRELELEAARTAVDAALDELLRLERPDEALELLGEALLVRANLAVVAGGDPRDDLMLLARIDRKLTELHPGLYPPSLVEAYARARADADAAPPGSIEVRARVAMFARADVIVDGVAVPQGATMLKQGPHLLVVRAPGSAPFARIVDVGEDALVLEPFLAPPASGERRQALVGAVHAARDDVSRSAALAQLGSLSAARSVVYLGREPPQLLHNAALLPLSVPSTASGAQLGLAVLAALQAPVKRDLGIPSEDDGQVATIVTITAAGFIVAAAATGFGVWFLVPPNEDVVKNPPPPPVTATCCVL